MIKIKPGNIYRNMVNILLFLILGMTSCNDAGRSFYVSGSGNDSNPGTLRKPFLTIQRAADSMVPGDVCFIRAGVYHGPVSLNSKGMPEKPIRFEAYSNERVVIDGTESLEGTWSVYKGNIYSMKVNRKFEQLFFENQMMVEARWPNMAFPAQLWDRSCWALSGKGSRYGIMVNDEMARSGIDWTGAVAVLNVAHQFVTWTRRVTSHKPGSNSFTYSKDLQPITHYADKTVQWEDDIFYLSGKLEALDSPGEWYLDEDKMELYFWAPDGENPGSGKVSVKTEYYGFDIADNEYIVIKGIEFFGTSLRLGNVNHSLVENCVFEYPSYSREFNDPSSSEKRAEILIQGNGNRFIKNHISFSQITGLVVNGTGNKVENNLLHDLAWNGQGFAIALGCRKNGEMNYITGNTAYNTGYSVIQPSGGKYSISYNHFYNAALVSKDCAVIQTGGWEIDGSIIHHNWVHDCYPNDNHPGGLKGGLGIRGDDQTRGLTVHHNVVWNCGRDGIIVKGDHNKVHNNTVFGIGSNNREGNYISLHTEPEPLKPWRKQIPLLEIQNQNTIAANNASFNIVGDRERNPFTPAKNLITNFTGVKLILNNPEKYDFSLPAGSPLIDAGTVIPGITDNYKGSAPDIGAYESGDKYWVPGTDWNPAEKHR